MIEIVGKHYSSIILGFFSLIGIIGISTVAQLLSEWIYASNVFFVGVLIVAFINSIHSILGNKHAQNNAKRVSETQKTNSKMILIESSLLNFEVIIKSLGVIFFANLTIICILLYAGSLTPEDYASVKTNITLGQALNLTNNSILDEKISISFLSIPAPWWLILQTICFLILSWFFTSNIKMIRMAVRRGFSFLLQKPLLKNPQGMQISPITSLVFLFALFFVGISGIVDVFELQVLISNWILIVLILIIQTIIFALLIDYFSSTLVIKHYHSKLYQLNMALTIIESPVHFFGSNTPEKEAEYIYHASRLFSPVKMNWLIFFSNYLLIPNVVYLNEEYQDLINRYLMIE